MIEFFRDVLDGPLYIVITILSIIFIMAIIGFLMERKKLEKEAKDKIAIVDTPILNTIEEVKLLDQVAVQEEKSVEPISDLIQEENFFPEVQKPVIVFEDPDQKNE